MSLSEELKYIPKKQSIQLPFLPFVILTQSEQFYVNVKLASDFFHLKTGLFLVILFPMILLCRIINYLGHMNYLKHKKLFQLFH